MGADAQIPATVCGGQNGACMMAASGNYVAVGNAEVVVYSWNSLQQWVQVHLRQCALSAEKAPFADAS